MSVRPDVVELLHAGYGDRTIARQLGLSIGTITRHRAALNMPAGRPGPKPAGSVDDLFWRRTTPAPNGHLLWTGYRSNGLPVLKHDGHRYSAYRIAFRALHQREPVGQVRPGCDQDGCVHPRCMEDQAMRDRFRKIFGGAS